MLVINCKNYTEIAGERIIEFVNIVQKISDSHNVEIAVAPPQHLIGALTNTENINIPIIAQHVDVANVGSTTGFVIPEMLKESGVRGSLINHSEHRISPKSIQNLVQRMKELEMTSIVCVQDEDEVKRYAEFAPDYIAIEPPELIGTGRAISKERPDLIKNANKVINSARKEENETKLLCGAGIVTGVDVEKAIQYGAKGVLVASGIIKNPDWNKIISDFAKSMLIH